MVAGITLITSRCLITARTSPSTSISSRTFWVSGRSRWPVASSRPRNREAAGVAPGSLRRRREVDVGQSRPRLRAEEPEGRLAQGEPDEAQVREIRRQGIDVDWSKMNAGQVADMLDYRKAQALSRARQKVGVAQCSTDAPSSVASAIIDGGTKQQAPDEDGRARTDPKVVVCAPSSARDTAFASQCTSRKSSANTPLSETRVRRPRVIGPRRKIRFPPGLQVLCHNCNLAKSELRVLPPYPKDTEGRLRAGGGIRIAPIPLHSVQRGTPTAKHRWLTIVDQRRVSSSVRWS